MQTKTTNLLTSLTSDDCSQRLTEALSESRQFSGLVEGGSWRLNLRPNLSLTYPKDAPFGEPVLYGKLIPLDAGTLVQCDRPLESSGAVEWRRMLFVLLPLLVGGALLLLLLDISSWRDWFLALILPALLVLLVLARRAFGVFQARAARREALDILRRVLEAEDVIENEAL